jgi:hypothetical protein
LSELGQKQPLYYESLRKKKPGASKCWGFVVICFGFDFNQRVWSLKPGAAPIDCLGNQPEPTQEERLASKQLRGARESRQGI